jgi:hypothetical protein
MTMPPAEPGGIFAFGTRRHVASAINAHVFWLGSRDLTASQKTGSENIVIRTMSRP